MELGAGGGEEVVALMLLLYEGGVVRV